MRSSPLERVLDRLEQAGKRAAKRGDEFVSPCPAHDDEDPSLSLRAKEDGRVLMTCRAGCATEAVVGALRLTMADLFPTSQGEKPGKRRVVATYGYHDE